MSMILAFSPHAAWKVHSNYETTILRGCQLRKANVRHILCDAVFAECDMHSFAKTGHGRPANLCQVCQRDAKEAIESAGLPYEWLGQSITTQEHREVYDWVQTLHPHHFRNACYQGFPVGELVASSVISTFRAFPIQIEDYQTASVYRGYLQAGTITFIAASRLLDKYRPDALLLFNGRFSAEKIALELAKKRGIRVLIHETTRVPGTLWISENEDCTNPEPFQRFWKEWQEVPLQRSQLEDAARWVTDRRSHASPIDHHCSTQPTGAQNVIATLQLQSYQKIIALYTTSTDEFESNPQFKIPFPSQEQWIDRILQWIEGRPHCCLVIRVHPCLSGNVLGIGRSHFFIDWYNQLKRRLPRNARLVDPEDSLSSYDLMDAAHYGITYGSTCGLEMLALGKPVAVVPGFALYQGIPGVVSLNNPTTLESQLDHLIRLDTSRELRRYAFRCIYRYFFDMVVPFSLVSMTGIYSSKLNYSSCEEIRNTDDPGLRRICDFLVDGTPIYPKPDLIDHDHTPSDEDSFFDELEGVTEKPVQLQVRSSEPLEPAAAERQQHSSNVQLSKNADSHLPHPTRGGMSRLLRKNYRSCKHNLRAFLNLLVGKRG